MWSYYRNALEPAGLGDSLSSTRGRWYRQAQEVGLPPRITGAGTALSATFGASGPTAFDDRARARREVVVENDIAWRIHAMVDFMFGKPATVVSTARDQALRALIDPIIDAVWENSGGIGLLQDAALLGHVYGHVDFLVRVDPDLHLARADDPASIARCISIEIIDPTRGIPILDPSDYRRLIGYIVHFQRETNEIVGDPTTRSRDSGFRVGIPTGADSRDQSLSPPDAGITRTSSSRTPRRRTTSITEVLWGGTSGEGFRRLSEDDVPVASWPTGLPPGECGVVHVQNLAQPFRYEGLSDVEPLVPLQDELNTRLSDRASRVTMQSFKMYLAKGIDGFDKAPVGPGQVWTTDNQDAEIEAFGGDANSPSEEQHILEVREAMDKISAVPPLASGVVRAKLGNLSSANALRITLMGTLAKTARKRVTYGRGISHVCRLILSALHTAGVLTTDQTDRAVRIEWPEPIPEDPHERVLAAEARQRLGVSRDRVLAELGYATTDPGIQ
jgi:hypothetical protein